jgi:DNA polymerase-3 subunit delta
MARVKAIELDAHLEDSPPAPVYALVGQDEALRARSLKLLCDFLAPEEQPGTTVSRLEGEPEPREVFDELQTIPFMGLEGRRVVIVSGADAFLAAHADRLCRYLERPAATGTLILVLDALDRRSEPAAAIAAEGLIVNCSSLGWREAESWLRSRARRMDSAITPDAAHALVEAVGPNVLALGNELEKLGAYCGPGQQITAGDVAELVPEARSRSVFELGDLIGRGDCASALALSERLLRSGESPEGLVAVLAVQTRRLWQIMRLDRDGTSRNQIAGALGVPRFVVRRALRGAERVTADALAARLAILAEADHELKTASMRSGEQDVWVENLVARLCEA